MELLFLAPQDQPNIFPASSEHRAVPQHIPLMIQTATAASVLMTFRRTSEKDSNLGEAFLRKPTSFYCTPATSLPSRASYFQLVSEKTNESLIPIPIIYVMQGYCRNLQKYRKFWKIKCNLRSCGLFHRKRNQIYVFALKMM